MVFQEGRIGHLGKTYIHEIHTSGVSTSGELWAGGWLLGLHWQRDWALPGLTHQWRSNQSQCRHSILFREGHSGCKPRVVSLLSSGVSEQVIRTRTLDLCVWKLSHFSFPPSSYDGWKARGTYYLLSALQFSSQGLEVKSRLAKELEWKLTSIPPTALALRVLWYIQGPRHWLWWLWTPTLGIRGWQAN